MGGNCGCAVSDRQISPIVHGIWTYAANGIFNRVWHYLRDFRPRCELCLLAPISARTLLKRRHTQGGAPAIIPHMSYGMYISAEGADAQAQRLEVIANNMANVDTAGFKQDVPTFQARFAEAIQQGLAQAGEQVDQRRRRRREVHRHADRFRVRALQADWQRSGLRDQRATASSKSRARRQTNLTRAGDFMLDRTGKLVTKTDSRPVLDQGGNEIVLSTELPFSVSQDGFIAPRWQLRCARDVAAEFARRFGEGRQQHVSAAGSGRSGAAGERQFRQGYLEMSGANPVNR